MPKISIIVPVYKVERYLKRCIDSIINQSFVDWECILVDDGSPDNSGRICEEYAGKDSRFKVFHQVNAGVSAARNKGISEAKGEWIVFVDSDDWIEKDMITEMFNCAIINRADVVLCGFMITDAKNKEIKIAPKFGWLDMPKDFVWYLQSPWAKLFNRTIIHQNNIHFPEGIVLAEDLFFTFQMYINVKRIYGLNNAFYNYFQDKESAAHLITEEKINDEVKVVKMIENELKNNGLTTKWLDFLDNKKNYVRDKYLFSLKKPHIDLWRITFPEVSNKNIYEKWYKKVLKKIVYIGWEPVSILFLKIYFINRNTMIKIFPFLSISINR